MVELFSEKNRCCGCMACFDACPTHAISIRSDSEGFSYPEIEKGLCIDCGRCIAVCPFVPEGSGKPPFDYIAAQASNQALRDTCTSGAVFPVLAQAILEQGGVVYGAGFDDSMRVTHQRADSLEGLKCLMRTKYVQSRTEGVFRQVERDLKDGRRVLFAGTPCQTEAVRRFFDREHPGLVLVDLICYGVPSPGVWERYVEYLEKKHQGKLKRFLFRDKRNHDDGHTVSFRIGDQEHVEEDYGNDPFLSLYFSNCIIRPSCYACPFTTVRRNSDITLGDLWGVEKAAPEMDDGMGTSLVMLRSEQAEELWGSLRDRFDRIECRREDVMQPRLESPTSPSPIRRLFFALYRLLPFSVFTWKSRFKRILHGRR